ncbi:hypothetical protein PRUB_b0078 [Pseudoalteromonas rubra]|uniref:Uncharacterized protein n=1 Tax=Pseudoalteromonas rubra TaxID=43658 RepID=A0A8T0BZU8_9GAMM|nr:hypothetical protein PRUB_b0078 [Pseudoalteromonas rubra]
MKAFWQVCGLWVGIVGFYGYFEAGRWRVNRVGDDHRSLFY